MDEPTILWRRLDNLGHEGARLSQRGTNWILAGAALFVYEKLPCWLEYSITCNQAWETVSCQVSGGVGHDQVKAEIGGDSSHRWRLNDQEVPAVANCIDLDLNFGPATNLLPIRRLDLAIGGSAEITAAWLRFPSFELQALRQIYRRTGKTTYRYESAGGAFVRDLEVDQQGFVLEYPGFWSLETSI